MSHEMALGGHLVVEVLRKFCVKVVSIRSPRPYARGHQTALCVKVIDQMPLISDG